MRPGRLWTGLTADRHDCLRLRRHRGERDDDDPPEDAEFGHPAGFLDSGAFGHGGAAAIGEPARALLHYSGLTAALAGKSERFSRRARTKRPPRV
jgi:hypothetical protein